MESITHSSGKTPAHLTVRESLFEKSRADTSLTLLTRKFAELLRCSGDGVLDLNIVSQKLNAPKRRVYDITNVLEGIQLIKKKSKNCIEWLGSIKSQLHKDLHDLTVEEKRLDDLILNCTQQARLMCEDSRFQRFAYLTYEDVQRIPTLRDQTVIVIKAPAETKLEVPHPEESLQIHLLSTQGPIEVYLCSDESTPMDTTGHRVQSAGTSGFSPVDSHNSL
ncbi:transcription factor E2F3 [Betta splendens]|uniref:Transcription factor E2F3 n=1 Tax=Betta splendens TaxID=158456 RepID=A0A9W2Y480_BETSP|nr:transcription factor E2F3 [Betta splendens]